MLDDDKRPFLDAEELTNDALQSISKDVKLEENDLSLDEKISSLTVQELLEELKTDDFEKLYITTAARSNTPNMEEIPDDQVSQVQSVAEYQLAKMLPNQEIDEKTKEKLKSASNFYMIPRVAEYKFNVGSNNEMKETKFFHTVNDVEGYCLYTVIGENDVTLSTNAKNAIEKYVRESYSNEIASKELSVDEVVEEFTPHNLNDLYSMVGDEHPFSMRFLSDRVDEFVKSKGISEKAVGTREVMLDEYDNLSEETKVTLREEPENKLQEQEKETLEEPEGKDGQVIDKETSKVKDEKGKEKQEKHYESIVEKIARINRVNPAVVNTRVIENFEKVEEDTGIPLKGRYQRGQVVAVRIPYKLGYRTFLADRATGMTIDGRGSLDRKPGKLRDYDEIEDYFRFKLRDGTDGGDGGKPLRYDENRDYTTYIDEHGDLQEQKYINNGKKQDMLRDERERYLTEVGEADKRLAEAIEEYQKHSTHENYQKVREIIQQKVDIDNKYNALDEQREVTEKTKENTEYVIGRDLDKDDSKKTPFDDDDLRR